MKENPKRLSYVLPTGGSLLFTKVIEAIHDHKLGNDYKIDHYPLYRLAVALSDKNTVAIFAASERGLLNSEGQVS